MTWRYVSIIALAGLGPVACGVWGGDEEPAAAAPTTQEAQPTATEADPLMPEEAAAPAPGIGVLEAQPTATDAESSLQEEAESPLQEEAAEAAPQIEPAVAVTPISDGFEEPWFPTQTGTVNPGWTAEQVISVWGEPVLERAAGEWTFLFYRNGCEYACGTFDIVILERNQVVDAIVRGPGHTYSGVSSSPPGRVAEFTPPTSPSDTNGVIG